MTAGASLVAPFCALRYADPFHMDDVLSPPYDVIDPERRAALGGVPHNIVHLILPAGDGDRYQRAARRFAEWCRDGVLVRDTAPAVTVLQQEFETADGATHRRTGVIGGLHVEPYELGRVRPHEHTHAGPKEDRLALSRATGAMLESIFVLARDGDGRLRQLLSRVARQDPTGVASLDGVMVRWWVVADGGAIDIAQAAGTDALYIADGHHRYETANAYRAERRDADRLPALVVPLGDPGLVVLATHRVVAGRPVDAAPLLAAWGERFRVERVAWARAPEALERLPRGRPACVVAVGAGAAYALEGDPVGHDDPEIAYIESAVVRPLRDAAGPEAEIGYEPRAGTALESIRVGGNVAAVLVPPTPIERVLDVSDAGGVMPPKSTFFAPKVPSGLVIMPYD